MNEPFASVADALKFAFNREGGPDRPAMSKASDKCRGGGNGFFGVDAAGQAGMILGEVASLGNPGMWVIQARYSPRSIPCACRSACCSGRKTGKEYKTAIGELQQAVLGELSGCLSSYRLRVGLVGKYFGESINFRELAEYCRVDRDTASDHNSRVTRYLKSAEARAWREISDRLLACEGLIER